MGKPLSQTLTQTTGLVRIKPLVGDTREAHSLRLGVSRYRFR